MTGPWPLTKCLRKTRDCRPDRLNNEDFRHFQGRRIQMSGMRRSGHSATPACRTQGDLGRCLRSGIRLRYWGSTLSDGGSEPQHVSAPPDHCLAHRWSPWMALNHLRDSVSLLPDCPIICRALVVFYSLRAHGHFSARTGAVRGDTTRQAIVDVGRAAGQRSPARRHSLDIPRHERGLERQEKPGEDVGAKLQLGRGKRAGALDRPRLFPLPCLDSVS